MLLWTATSLALIKEFIYVPREHCGLTYSAQLRSIEFLVSDFVSKTQVNEWQDLK